MNLNLVKRISEKTNKERHTQRKNFENCHRGKALKKYQTNNET